MLQKDILGFANLAPTLHKFPEELPLTWELAKEISMCHKVDRYQKRGECFMHDHVDVCALGYIFSMIDIPEE